MNNPMTPEPTDWIAIETRRPTEADLPIWCYQEASIDGVKTWLWPRVFLSGCGEFTHWKPAQLPPPPPKSRTQREEDEEAYINHFAKRPYGVCTTGSIAWQAALAFRDAQNRADLETLDRIGLIAGSPVSNARDRLRKRAGL